LRPRSQHVLSKMQLHCSVLPSDFCCSMQQLFVGCMLAIFVPIFPSMVVMKQFILQNQSKCYFVSSMIHAVYLPHHCHTVISGIRWLCSFICGLFHPSLGFFFDTSLQWWCRLSYLTINFSRCGVCVLSLDFCRVRSQIYTCVSWFIDLTEQINFLYVFMHFILFHIAC